MGWAPFLELLLQPTPSTLPFSQFFLLSPNSTLHLLQTLAGKSRQKEGVTDQPRVPRRSSDQHPSLYNMWRNEAGGD